MWKNIIAGTIGAIVAGIFLFFIFLPSELKEELRQIDKRLSRLEGQFDTFTTLQKDFSDLMQQVSTVQDDVKAVTATVEVDQTEFTFLEPDNGSSVPRYFGVKGTLSRPISWGHLWLAVEIGGLAWPKEPEVKIVDNNWFGEVNEGGEPPNGEFRLSLWHVDETGQEEIQQWLQNGHRSGRYPGLHGVPGGRRLESINLRLQP